MHRFPQCTSSLILFLTSWFPSDSSLSREQVIRDMDLVEKVLRESCAKSPDGKITQRDFVDHASRTMRYGTFSPMEVSIIFHFAGQGGKQRLGLRDFNALLDPKWGPPRAAYEEKGRKKASGGALHEIGKVSSQASPLKLLQVLTLDSLSVCLLLLTRRSRWCPRSYRCLPDRFDKSESRHHFATFLP